MTLAAASAAILGLASCEKASDKAAAEKAPPTFNVDYCAAGSLDAPSHLSPVSCVLSPNKAFVLVMQPTGALELAKVTATGQLDKPTWSSDSTGSAPGRAAADFQEDGNLVIYDRNKPIWNSHTAGKPGRYSIAVEDLGNAVIKNPDGQIVWAAQLDPKLCPTSLDAPTQLAVQGCISSPNKAFVMVLGKAGALQVSPVAADGSQGQPIWSSGNHLGKPGEAPFMALQSDGNLVVYLAGRPAWDAKTALGAGAYHLDLSDEGELKLHRGDGAVIWSSKTGKAKA